VILRWRRAFAVALLAFTGAPVHAAGIDSFSPQGEVRDVRQAVARFSAPVGASRADRGGPRSGIRATSSSWLWRR